MSLLRARLTEKKTNDDHELSGRCRKKRQGVPGLASVQLDRDL
jgi:hypothetical protein